MNPGSKFHRQEEVVMTPRGFTSRGGKAGQSKPADTWLRATALAGIEVPGRLHVEPFTLAVADHRHRLSAVPAVALLRRAGDRSFRARQRRG